MVMGPSILRPRSLISFTSNRVGQTFASSLPSTAGSSRTLARAAWMSSRRPAYAALMWMPSSRVLASCRRSQFTLDLAVLRSSGASIVMLLVSVLPLRSTRTFRLDTPSGIRYSISSPSSLQSPSTTRLMNSTGSSRSALLSFTGTGWCSSSVSCRAQVPALLDPSSRHLQGRFTALLDSGAGGNGLRNVLPACWHPVEAGHAGAGVAEESHQVLDDPAMVPILDLAPIGQQSALS